MAVFRNIARRLMGRRGSVTPPADTRLIPMPHLRTRGGRSLTALAALALLLTAAGGCQVRHSVTNDQLIQHQALIDFSDLKPAEVLTEVNVQCSPPSSWAAMPLKKNGMYAHQQWRSPSSYTGVGAVYVRLPLPLSEKTILWFAKKEYTKRSKEGREIAQWTDEVGRHWFEAENNEYHVQGYVIARGFNAWLVYFGYKTGHPPDVAELSLAARCAQTFIPQATGVKRKKEQGDDGSEADPKPGLSPESQPAQSQPVADAAPGR